MIMMKNDMLPYWKRKKKKKPALENGTEKPKKRTADPVKKLDKVFSLYVRLRDCMPNGYGRCIACGRIKQFSELDCGHYHSRTHMATRWHEDNANIECKACNRFSSEHLIGYRENLIRKIGMGRYDRLTILAHSTKHWMNEEMQAMIKHYTEEVKRLSKEKGIKVNL